MAKPQTEDQIRKDEVLPLAPDAEYVTDGRHKPKDCRIKRVESRQSDWACKKGKSVACEFMNEEQRVSCHTENHED